MTMPVENSGKLISTNLLEEKFFQENRSQIDQFYKNIPNIINNNLKTNGDLNRQIQAELTKINFNEETKCFKKNILAAVSDYIYKHKK